MKLSLVNTVFFGEGDLHLSYDLLFRDHLHLFDKGTSVQNVYALRKACASCRSFLSSGLKYELICMIEVNLVEVGGRGLSGNKFH